MPLYDYNCSDCGLQSDLIRGYDDHTTPCPTCGKDAGRVAAYPSQYVTYKGPGFTKAVSVPRPTTPAEAAEVQHLLKKEMDTKTNYPTERVYDDLRQAVTHDAEGRPQVDTRKLQKTATRTR